MSKEAMKLALEALEVATTPFARDRQEVLRAQVALREALAEQQAQTDWESVAADQAMTIALLKVKLHGLIDEPPAAYMYEQAKYGPTDLRGQQWRPALSRNKPYTGDDKVRGLRPLYTHPIAQTWAGLTDEEIKECFDSVPTQDCQNYEHWRSLCARNIEAKLKEKNT